MILILARKETYIDVAIGLAAISLAPGDDSADAVVVVISSSLFKRSSLLRSRKSPSIELSCNGTGGGHCIVGRRTVRVPQERWQLSV